MKQVESSRKPAPRKPSLTRQPNSTKRPVTIVMLGFVAAFLLACCGMLSAQTTYTGPAFLPNPVQSVSVFPSNGDVFPAGVAIVPSGFPAGVLNPGDILVSNWNNALNLSGTGSTIVRIQPNGAKSTFFQGSTSYPNTGLDGALVVLKEGFVIVGNVPTLDGTAATVGRGQLNIINALGQSVGTITTNVEGAWGMAASDPGNGQVSLFVSNVLDGNVVRYDFSIQSGVLTLLANTTIASDYMHRTDPAAVVEGPAGLAFDSVHDKLYVASQVDNAIFVVPNALTTTTDAGRGREFYSDSTHLHAPLGLTFGPYGHLLATNFDVINQDPNQPSEIVEFTIAGVFVKEISVDPNVAAIWGVASATSSSGYTATLVTVDNYTENALIWTLPAK